MPGRTIHRKNNGGEGILCGNCSMGPCRVNSSGNKPDEGLCGADAKTIMAGNVGTRVAAGSYPLEDRRGGATEPPRFPPGRSVSWAPPLSISNGNSSSLEVLARYISLHGMHVPADNYYTSDDPVHIA